MKTGQYDQAVFYQIACDCGSNEHQLGLEMDVDNGILTLHLYADFEASVYWGKSNWFMRQWRKLKIILRLCFVGYIKMDQEFLIVDDKHVDSFINALQEGKYLLTISREE